MKATILRRHLDKKEKITLLSKEFNVPQNTISSWKQHKDKIFEEASRSVQPQRKRMRFSEYPDIEQALLYWLRDIRAMDQPPPLSLLFLMQQADRFAVRFGHTDWKCTRGFVHRFCGRYNILSKKVCGEALDCPDTETFITDTLLPLLQDYHPDNVYNADETAFVFKMMPQRMYAFKREKVQGGSTSKDRLTLMLCCNMTGSHKVKPMVIGKAKCPAILKRYNLTTKDLPVDYYHNTKGWMTGPIFHEWLSKWNLKLVRQQRKILLLIDNAPSHIVQDYSNIRVQFLPPNTTSKLQPLNQGIIRSVKCSYRRMLAELYLQGIENKEDAKQIIKQKFNFKNACDMVDKAWKKVSPITIQNCFGKAGFITTVPAREEEMPHPDTDTWTHIQQTLDVHMPFDEFATADDSVETTDHLTEEEIVRQVQLDNMSESHITVSDESDLDDDDNDTTNEVDDSNNIINTTDQFIDISSQIRAFLQRNKLDTKILDDLEQQVIDSKIKRNTVQQSICRFLQQ